MYKVIVVDDHILLTQAIAGLIATFENFEILYLCKNGKELLTKLKACKTLPDIVLMDVKMPILNGIETTEHLKNHYPQIKVLALSVEENENIIIKMLKAGAKGYLLKDVKKNTLETALNQVAQHGYYHTKNVSNILINSLNGDEKSKTLRLKKRELEFVQHACSDLTYKEIAEKMFLSPKTIDGYRDTLFQKFYVKNRVGLVLHAIKNRIIEM